MTFQKSDLLTGKQCYYTNTVYQTLPPPKKKKKKSCEIIPLLLFSFVLYFCNGHWLAEWGSRGGSQILIVRGCTVGSSEPIPMFRGNVSKNKYPCYRDFSEKRYPFLVILPQKYTKIFQKILKIRPIT